MSELQFKDENGVYVCVVTSCKGGIGKSTVCANLAAALAARGRRVLCVDCDYSNRALDLIFGVDGRLTPGVDRYINEDMTPSDAVMTVREGELWFIPGPEKNVVLRDAARFERKILDAARAFGCNTIFIDTPGASDGILPAVVPMADTGIVVASHMPTSIRGAERMGQMLAEYGVSERLLIVNRFDASDVLKGLRPGVNELIDRTYIRLIGVVPDSKKLELAQEQGLLADEILRDRDRTSEAFDEIAARLCGERVPLMSYLPRSLRRKLTRTNFRPKRAD